MKIFSSRRFDRQYKELQRSERERVDDRLALFREDEFHPLLNNHPLQGKYAAYRSINIGGDLRALYKTTGPDVRVFVIVDTHGNLYE